MIKRIVNKYSTEHFNTVYISGAIVMYSLAGIMYNIFGENIAEYTLIIGMLFIWGFTTWAIGKIE